MVSRGNSPTKSIYSIQCFLNCSNGTSKFSVVLCVLDLKLWYHFWVVCVSFALVGVCWRLWTIVTAKPTSWMCCWYWYCVCMCVTRCSVSVLHSEMKHSLVKVVEQVALIIYEWQIIPLAHVVIFMYARSFETEWHGRQYKCWTSEMCSWYF